MTRLQLYLTLLWRLCGYPVLLADEEWRQMLARNGWRPFIVERVGK